MMLVTNSSGDFDSLLVELSSVVANADYEPVLQDFQQDLAQGEAEAFQSEHEPGGSPWLPLKPSTMKRKHHAGILFDTGALMASLITVGGPGNVHETNPRGLLFGTDVEYSIFHQEGTAKMPARPHVGTTEDVVDRLMNRIADDVVKQLTVSGR